MSALPLTSVNFDQTIKSGVSLVDFWAPWCGPCKMAGPIIDQLSEEYAGKITVGKINVDEEQSLAGKYGVQSIPTVILFKDGVEAGRQVGFSGKQGYLDLLSKQTS